MQWTTEKVDDLRRMAAARYGGARIADALGVTLAAAYQAAKTRGISILPLRVSADDGLKARWLELLPAMKEQLRADTEAIMAER